MKKYLLKLSFIALLTLISSCSWANKILDENSGEYSEDFFCSKEIAMQGTLRLVEERGFTGLIINEDGSHGEIWFKLEDDSRVRVQFQEGLLFSTRITIYIRDGKKANCDALFQVIHKEIFESEV